MRNQPRRKTLGPRPIASSRARDCHGSGAIAAPSALSLRRRSRRRTAQACTSAGPRSRTKEFRSQYPVNNKAWRLPDPAISATVIALGVAWFGYGTARRGKARYGAARHGNGPYGQETPREKFRGVSL